jgi:hypothetical protein
MLVLKANQTQYEALDGYTYGVSKLIFVKDGADNWIVGLEVIDKENFLAIRNDLLKLEQIEYIPLINNDQQYATK